MLLIRIKDSRLIICFVLAVMLLMLQTNTVKANPYHYDLNINAGEN